MKVNNAPAGTAVKVVFYRGDLLVLEIWTGDEKVNTQQFQIVAPAGAGK